MQPPEPVESPDWTVCGEALGSATQQLSAPSVGHRRLLDAVERCLSGGSVATLSGGSIYTADMPFADVPKGGLFGGTLLAVGPTAAQAAALTFTGPGVDYVNLAQPMKANCSVTPVTEPETCALMLAALGALGFVACRRREQK